MIHKTYYKPEVFLNANVGLYGHGNSTELVHIYHGTDLRSCILIGTKIALGAKSSIESIV